jgi:PKHD-type hydroxylase
VQFQITPRVKDIIPWAYWDDAFSPEQLDWIQAEIKKSTGVAQVGNGDGGVVNSDLRRSRIGWMANTPDTSWVFERLGHVVANLNAECFNFDLDGFGESLQLTNYDQETHGMYGWHTDFGKGVSRKLSLVLQLSDPSEYEGGELQLQPRGATIESMVKKRGRIVVFPAWTLHQVTPVTKGYRQTLVAWISGAPFR